MNKWCLLFLALWAFLEFSACAPSKKPKDCYELPDGAMCRVKYFNGVFQDCDNGREYLDPAWSKWHEQCPKEFK